jgi:valyl-tRNA synthetase
MKVLGVHASLARPANSASGVAGEVQVFLPLGGLIDAEAERKRLGKEIEKLEGFVKAVQAKLANQAFVAKAPAAVVEAERLKISESQGSIEKLKASLRELG